MFSFVFNRITSLWQKERKYVKVQVNVIKNIFLICSKIIFNIMRIKMLKRFAIVFNFTGIILSAEQASLIIRNSNCSFTNYLERKEEAIWYTFLPMFLYFYKYLHKCPQHSLFSSTIFAFLSFHLFLKD